MSHRLSNSYLVTVVIFLFWEWLCIFTIFTGVNLTPAEEEDLRGRWQRAVGPRYEVIVSFSVRNTNVKLCISKISALKQCMFSLNLDKILWWYVINTLRNIFLKVCQLERFGETSGLGISLEARAGHHYLCSILAEGPVGQSGKIFLGDQILEVTNRYQLLKTNWTCSAVWSDWSTTTTIRRPAQWSSSSVSIWAWLVEASNHQLGHIKECRYGPLCLSVFFRGWKRRVVSPNDGWYNMAPLLPTATPGMC